MFQSGTTYLPTDCCFNEQHFVSTLKIQLRVLVFSFYVSKCVSCCSCLNSLHITCYSLCFLFKNSMNRMFLSPICHECCFQFTWTKGPGELLPSLGVRRPSSVVCKLFTFQASSPKPHGRLEPNLAGMFLGWSSTKLLFFVPVEYSIWLPGPIICSDWLKFQRSSSLKLMN